MKYFELQWKNRFAGQAATSDFYGPELGFQNGNQLGGGI
jgi:hypothetical protein